MKQEGIKTKHRIYTMSFASVYPEYVAKAKRKGRTKAEVDEIICWLTGYSQEKLEAQLKKQTDFETFLAEAPQMNPSRALIKGVVCGVREAAVGVFALPPRETGLSKFWSAITRRTGDTPEIVRLKVEPPVPMTDFRKGDHTRLSAMHPYVVMEDDTRYGIGLWIPKGLFGEWSEPQEREAKGGIKLMGEREVFQQRRVPAILIRLDGETPLGESVSELGTRQEILLGVPEPKESTGDDVFVVVTNRQVTGAKGREDRADVSDLSFNVLAERGTDGNAVIDNKGLVQVVVVQATEDHVIERITPPTMFGLTDSGFSAQRYGEFDFTREVMKGGATFGDSGTLTGVNSTLRGETRFTDTRREKVSIKGITDVEPVAEFNLALVGNGGPVTAEMTEAPQPEQA